MTTDKNVTGKAQHQHYDLIVIGSGPAGINGALQAAKLNKKVAIVEQSPDRLGGAWIHTGTIPSKTMREALAAIQSINYHAGHQWVERIVHNLSSAQLRDRARQVCMAEEDLIRNHIESNHIEVIRGFGRIESANTVRVIPKNQQSFLMTTDYILVATGSRPRRPSHIPFDGWRVIDSDEILTMDALPRSILVFGAGVIGCEYACIFGAIGAETTIVDARPRIMQTLDHEISEELKRSMEGMGIRFKLNTRMSSLKIDGPQVTTHFDDGNNMTTDVFFFAAGRDSCTSNIGLERVGIKMNERSAILVNEFFQTAVGNIYAAGDAIGPPALAATSSEQGRVAICHAFGSWTKGFPKVYPLGVYTIPEVSSVGQTEEELKESNTPFVVGRASYSEIARGYIRGDHHGLLKLLACPKTLQILGVHIVGADAANLVHIGQCCMLAGMPLDEMVSSVIFNYPTLAEAYRIAAFNALNQVYPDGNFENKHCVLTTGE